MSTYKGWYAGAGVEYVLMNGDVFDLIGGLEYQHIDLGTQPQLSSLDFPPFSACPPGFNCRSISAKVSLVRVRLTVKLNPVCIAASLSQDTRRSARYLVY
ncbi:MAG TPA: hypothetical protein VK337_07425 [Xanthobacteraceae bacterium]|nr:hypothetical protein [Xanthobacteraceae bacterium]